MKQFAETEAVALKLPVLDWYTLNKSIIANAHTMPDTMALRTFIRVNKNADQLDRIDRLLLLMDVSKISRMSLCVLWLDLPRDRLTNFKAFVQKIKELDNENSTNRNNRK